MNIEFEQQLEKSKEYDYSLVIEKLETIQAPLSYSWSVVNHLKVMTAAFIHPLRCILDSYVQ